MYKLNLATTGANTTSSTGLKAVLANDQKVMIRSSSSFQFSGVESTTTRPSSALIFDESETVYRTLAFNTTDSLGATLASGVRHIRFDSPYDYIKLVIDNTNAALTTFAGAGGTTMGNTAGDDVIAVVTITSQDQIDRLNSGDMIFVWDGKTHQITGYTQRSGFGTIAITDVAGKEINSSSLVTGIHSTLVNTQSVVTLRAGLASTEGAEITINISTCRATGHDFLNIGTGGFNSSNYPNSTFGQATQTKDQTKETDERDKGRVFYVSTDQDGFFRVGKFFQVDQGTGTVTFSASIALSDVDGLGFKRGVVITEFSTDTAMTDNASDTVPTEGAVRGYVNRRLGYDVNGTAVSNKLGPGVLAPNGVVPMTGDLNAASNTITNLKTPAQDSDAATKSYVDNIGGSIDVQGLRSSEYNDYAAGHIFISTGEKKLIISAGSIVSGGAGATARPRPTERCPHKGLGRNFVHPLLQPSHAL